MKATLKLMSLSLIIFFMAAVFAYAQAAESEESPPLPPEPPAAEPMAELPRGPGLRINEEYITDLLEKIKQDDPNEAARLEKLQQDNPRLFQVEIRKLAWQQKAQQEGFGPDRSHHREGMPNAENEPIELRRKDRRHERLLAIETEFTSWLEKNEPQIAKELAELKEKDRPAYARRLSIEMKKYREIVEAEQTNPALAELLKKDLESKKKRNELLEKLKGTTDEKQKEELTAQLKEVTGERFDVIVQKKQLKYEELKKKLEQLQQQVNKSQAELENFKSKKTEQIEKHVQELLSQSEKIDWD